ncbi:class I SAM-dependent methyltransferase [Prosthecomicrobium sp. N25]|uniref:class I SAM-dependent methyltransferase n=1 Tax=Prosthecomicrobium sp. N25 TaxID=3129254 RepID=UPI0030774FB7
MSGAPRDLARFVRDNTRVSAPPHVPEIRLHLADEAVDLWHRTEAELEALGLPLPFWAFAWAGGQALARYLLDRPGTVAGRRVMVFAGGSGLEAIGAARAGAARVLATDIDPFALVAMRLNAEENGVAFEISDADLVGTSLDGFDLLLLGDVFYERPMADRVAAWARAEAAAGRTVLVGDPGRSYLPRQDLDALAEYRVPTPRALEDADVKRTVVWRVRA